ncbi:flagellar export protein FliJ [Ferrimonas lipolytica]|uniref:Flagellar FliJ protein n=1 Tax=Ferrimonas lipolytica TaxID=2724191 RepID=A0A6H1UCN7_9GAMM|nr:flagellar export protein FliJ [Ferrimonas lipolytica]QIZ76804.1 FliJ family protein [Ferrimonas lipolytica]
MATKALDRLAEQMEQQLHRIGKQRADNQSRLTKLEQVERQIAEFLQQQQGQFNCINQLQNQQQMAIQLLQVSDKNQQKISLLQTERQRLDKLWRYFLQRRQGLRWLIEQRLEQARISENKAEQRQLDELAMRCHQNSGNLDGIW